MLLSYKCVIKTSLTKDKIFELLQEETITDNVHSIFVKVSDYIFWEGRFAGNRFSCMPLPRRVPPYGTPNSFLPEVMGEVKEKGEYREVEIVVSKTYVYQVFLIIDFLAWIVSIFGGVGIVKYTLLLWGAAIAVVGYFQFTARKTAQLFEGILQGCSDAIKKRKIVNGKEADYAYYDRKLKAEDFLQFDHNTTYEEMVKRIGIENGIYGYGEAWPYYELSDGTYAICTCSTRISGDRIRGIVIVDKGKKLYTLLGTDCLDE